MFVDEIIQRFQNYPVSVKSGVSRHSPTVDIVYVVVDYKDCLIL